MELEIAKWRISTLNKLRLILLHLRLRKRRRALVQWLAEHKTIVLVALVVPLGIPLLIIYLLRRLV